MIPEAPRRIASDQAWSRCADAEDFLDRLGLLFLKTLLDMLAVRRFGLREASTRKVENAYGEK